MSNSDISPLAKRLAEENNVDWRALRGSGEEGRVVERDVLDYLARVMAGEEDPDPTPEPLPPGMESWTDDDSEDGTGSSWTRTTSGRGDGAGDGADTLWADSDDDSFGPMEPDTGSERRVTGSEATGEGHTDTGGFDGAPTEASAIGGTESDIGAGGQYDFDVVPDDGSEIDEDIFVFGDEPASGKSESGSDRTWADEISGFDEGDRTSGSSDFASDDFFGLEAQEPEDAHRGDGREFSWDDTQPLAPPSGASSAGEARRESAWEERETVRPQAPGERPVEPAAAPWEAETEGGEGGAGREEPEVATPRAVTGEQPGMPWDRQTPNAPVGAADTETRVGDPALPEGVALEESETRVPGSPGQVTESEYPGESRPDSSLAARVQTEPAPIARTRGFSGSGIVLRRDVELTALREAQMAVSRELGLGENLSPASFLLRAAARAGAPWPLASATATVSLAVLTDDGVAITHLPRASDMPFRELVTTATQASGGDDVEESSLVVADLSVLGIDEAVLDLGRPVLTLGRVLPLNENGRFHGTLALSGPVAPDAGSRFLARVVELLAAPVRLVL